MKINNALLVVAFALCSTVGAFSTDSPFGTWLPATPGDSWADYCKPGGSKLNTYHACIQFDPVFFQKITKYYDFQAHVAPDFTGFAALYHGPDNDTGFETDKYRFYVRSVTDDAGKVRVDCSHLAIWSLVYDDNQMPNVAAHTDQKCGAEAMVLPKFVWDDKASHKSDCEHDLVKC
ncbi:conserved hypothetical Ustilaginaceae-specific protein [Sporisorium reilianum SRZ2]|uniref:Conserved hypothetical Ustilaginaceae-specific protein n=1 Tax=Sporisorium reilianum (strain SRZ2) TaxID=999809 RepID=E6ZLY3_SPORE|nr:conserved hypothetical Ustilaginaceae-specific protein [Sporisorium reilianum SRZ2]